MVATADTWARRPRRPQRRADLGVRRREMRTGCAPAVDELNGIRIRGTVPRGNVTSLGRHIYAYGRSPSARLGLRAAPERAPRILSPPLPPRWG